MWLDTSLDGATESVAGSARWQKDEVRQLTRLSMFGVVMGAIGSLAAWVLYHLIMIITGLTFYHQLTLAAPLYPPIEGLGAAAILVPVVGALIVGLMATYGSDRIKGHGIPEAMEAVLKHKSRVSPKVAVLKPISAAVAVGTGGPFGAEGPIIQTGGAIGSLIGQFMKLTAAERRTLLACGGAAGMVGIFNTPIAAVALALELLLFEFRARSLVPVILASAVAAALRVPLLGGQVMFNVGAAPAIAGPLDTLWFVPLGILIGVAAVGISKALYFVEEFIEHLGVSPIIKPAIGALVLGIVALFQPRVLGMGYTTITHILDNQFGNFTLAGLAVGKTIALVAALGSGTSGGLLAPMLMIGAAMGTGYGRLVHTLFPLAGINPAICGIVAMSSLFSAAARAPLTSFVFAFELTGDYHALVPLMIGCMVADIVARRLSSESVMTERLVRRGLRVDQGYQPSILNLVSVGEVMTRAVDTLAARTPIRVALRGLLGEPLALSLFKLYGLPVDGTEVVRPRDDVALARYANAPMPDDDEAAAEACSLALHRRWTFPVVDDRGRLVGVVTRGDLLNAAALPNELDAPVETIMKRDVVVATPDESLQTALQRMLAYDFAALPVVSKTNPAELLGILTRGDVLRAQRVRIEDETHRERSLMLARRRAAARAGVQTLEQPIATTLEQPRADDALASAEQTTLDVTVETKPADSEREPVQ